MTYRYERRYAGPIEAVIFDNAGTLVDFGSRAPVMAFAEVFKRRQVRVTEAEARGPMGAAKRDHIQQMLAVPAVADRWQAAHGRAATEADIDAMYADFLPVQADVVAGLGKLIPGALDTVKFLRDQGIKVGATTGYPGEIMQVLRPVIEKQGLVYDSLVTASDVKRGRPAPDMCLQSALNLGVSCVQACVNVDDSAPGLEAGLNSGMWVVGLACSGNEVGLTAEAWAALSEAEKAPLRARAAEKLARTGAHYVIDTVADLPEVIEEITARLAAGDAP